MRSDWLRTMTWLVISYGLSFFLVFLFIDTGGYARLGFEYQPSLRNISFFSLLLLPVIFCIALTFQRPPELVPDLPRDYFGILGSRNRRILLGVLFGLVLALFALRSQSFRPAGGAPYAIASGLYALPMLLGRFWLNMPDVVVVYLFWTVVCGTLGGLVGRYRGRIVYSVALVFALLYPCLFTMRGCVPEGGLSLSNTYLDYPSHLAAFSPLLLIGLLLAVAVHFRRFPLSPADDGYTEAWLRFTRRNILLGMLIGSILALFTFGALAMSVNFPAYSEPFARGLYFLPLFFWLLSTRLLVFSAPAGVILFWTLLMGAIGWYLRKKISRIVFVLTLLCALFPLVVFMRGCEQGTRTIAVHVPAIAYELVREDLGDEAAKEFVEKNFGDEATVFDGNSFDATGIRGFEPARAEDHWNE